MTAFTVETLLAAAGSKVLRADPELPGWVSSGFWAARVGGEHGLDVMDIAPGSLKSVIDAARADHRRQPLEERVEMRIPNLRTPTERTVYKDSCAGCECGRCTGQLGDRYTVREELFQYGQSVFVDPFGRSILVNPDFRPLLEGLSVALIGPWTGDPDRIADGTYVCGFDAENQLVVLICPLRGSPREPGQAGDQEVRRVEA